MSDTSITMYCTSMRLIKIRYPCKLSRVWSLYLFLFCLFAHLLLHFHFNILLSIFNCFSFLLSSFIYYQSRIKWYYFVPENLRWSGDNKHPTRPHTILKNKNAKNGERSSVFVFFSMVWGRVRWSIYHHSIWVFLENSIILFCFGNI